MRKTLGRMVLGTSAFALAVLGADARAATSKTMMTTSGATVPAPVAVPVSSSPEEVYSTTATIGTTGITSVGGAPATGPVGFGVVTNGAFGLNSFVSLGQFTVSTLSPGASTTYANTPFTITYNPVGVVNGTDKFAFGSTAPIMLSGVLNGTVTGDQSSVTATFTPGESPAFSTSDPSKGSYKSTLAVLNNSLGLVPSTTFDGHTTIQGQLTTIYAGATPTPLPSSGGVDVQTPEPTTFAILATSIIGLGLRHRLRSARKSA